MVQLL
jgi:hypothetical protein